VDFLITHSNLQEAKREVEMSVEIRVFNFVQGVIHTRKWVSVLTRNLVKTAVVNAKSKRAINLAKKNGELGSNKGPSFREVCQKGCSFRGKLS
jgi:hypothetical protein